MLDTNPTAMRVMRKNMVVFINADPINIVLSRATKVSTPAGGYVEGTPVLLAPQTFRMTPFKRRLSDFTKDTQDGKIPQADYILTGRWDCDILRGDTFTFNGDDLEVISVEPLSDDRYKTDRVVAQVRLQGKGLAWQTTLGS